MAGRTARLSQFGIGLDVPAITAVPLEENLSPEHTNEHPESAAGSPASEPRLFAVRHWLLVGAAFGVLDALAAAFANASTSGTWLDRFVTILATVAADGFAVSILAGLLWVPARIAARVLDRAPSSVQTALVSVVWAVGIASITVESLEARPSLDDWSRALLAVTVVLLCGGVAAAVVGFRRIVVRFSGEPAHIFWKLAALGLVMGAASLVPPRRDGHRPPVGQNVVLISLDTLRADHLGCYGYARPTSPNLDALASESTLFHEAYVPSHWTLPSHASILTGFDPVTLGIVEWADTLDERFVTLAERFADAGYRTAAFVGDGPYSNIGSERGFAQGFMEYHHPPYPARYATGVLLRGLSKAYWRFVQHRTATAGYQVGQVENWLWRYREDSFFLFLHFYDVHSDIHRLPYESPAPFKGHFYTGPDDIFDVSNATGSASDMLEDYASGKRPGKMAPGKLDAMMRMYDEGIAYTDHELGRLFQRMKELGLWDETVIVVTSDHGESFFEHGYPAHFTLNRENLHVPLIIRAPRGTIANRIDDRVQSIHLARTICDLAEVDCEGLPRPSFAGFVTGSGERHSGGELFSSSREQLSLRTSAWTFLRRSSQPTGLGKTPNVELYRRSDVSEESNLANSVPDVVRMMGAQTQAHLDANLAIRHRIGIQGGMDLTLRDDQIEALRKLGYVP